MRVLYLTLVYATLLSSVASSTAYSVGPVSIIVVPADAITIIPGVLVQSVVDAHPPGTTYFFAPGLYRNQQIVPKDGDRFIGAFGATLSGAHLLRGAVNLDNTYVFSDEAPDPNSQRHGVCRAGYPRCDRPQALFLDDLPLRAVDRMSDVKQGTWYFDYKAERVHMGDNPAGRKVELTYRPFAFGGTPRNVWVENLIVEKFASANQHGAINDEGGGKGWTIVNNEVRQNYGYGITLSAGSKGIGNYVHNNGQLGIGGGGGADILVENNEIAFNAWNGTDCDWECGGAKWGAATSIQVRGNYVHDNGGDGLWTDERCRYVLYEGNRIEGNARAGISHEISFNAVIRDNTFRGNGADTFTWGWDAQIQVQNSSETEIYGNRLELDPVRGGNGIALIQQNRGTAFALSNVFVHDNTVIMRGGHGAVAGWYADFDADSVTGRNNRFEANHYFVFSLASGADVWFANVPSSFATWQTKGADRLGSATISLP